MAVSRVRHVACMCAEIMWGSWFVTAQAGLLLTCRIAGFWHLRHSAPCRTVY
jgi:hypothetical protein